MNCRGFCFRQIKQIINYTAKRDADAVALDYWVFSFISNGMNFKDIALLKYGNINGDFIEFRRSKTQRILKNNSLPILVPVSDMIDKIIKKYSANPMLDSIHFFESVIFSFLTGNADMHLKNYSLIYFSSLLF